VHDALAAADRPHEAELTENEREPAGSFEQDIGLDERESLPAPLDPTTGFGSRHSTSWPTPTQKSITLPGVSPDQLRCTVGVQPWVEAQATLQGS